METLKNDRGSRKIPSRRKRCHDRLAALHRQRAAVAIIIGRNSGDFDTTRSQCLLDIGDCAARSAVHGRYGRYDLKDSHSLGRSNQAGHRKCRAHHFACSRRLSGTTSRIGLFTRSHFFRDGRANRGIDFSRRDLTHAMHVVDDAVPLPHRMPPLWPIEISEQCNARNSGGRRKMHRSAVMSDKKHRLFHCSRAFARGKASAQIQCLAGPRRGKLCRAVELIGRADEDQRQARILDRHQS